MSRRSTRGNAAIFLVLALVAAAIYWLSTQERDPERDPTEVTASDGDVQPSEPDGGIDDDPEPLSDELEPDPEEDPVDAPGPGDPPDPNPGGAPVPPTNSDVVAAAIVNTAGEPRPEPTNDVVYRLPPSGNTPQPLKKLDLRGGPKPLPEHTLVQVRSADLKLVLLARSGSTYALEGKGATALIVPEEEQGHIRLADGTVLVRAPGESGVRVGGVNLNSKTTRYVVRVNKRRERTRIECIVLDGTLVAAWNGEPEAWKPNSRWVGTADGPRPKENLMLPTKSYEELIRGYLTVDRARSLMAGVKAPSVERLMKGFRKTFAADLKGEFVEPLTADKRIDISKWALANRVPAEAQYQAAEAADEWRGEASRVAYADLYQAGALHALGRKQESVALYRDAARILAPKGGKPVPKWVAADKGLKRYVLKPMRADVEKEITYDALRDAIGVLDAQGAGRTTYAQDVRALVKGLFPKISTLGLDDVQTSYWTARSLYALGEHPQAAATAKKLLARDDGLGREERAALRKLLRPPSPREKTDHIQAARYLSDLAKLETEASPFSSLTSPELTRATKTIDRHFGVRNLMLEKRKTPTAEEYLEWYYVLRGTGRTLEANDRLDLAKKLDPELVRGISKFPTDARRFDHR